MRFYPITLLFVTTFVANTYVLHAGIRLEYASPPGRVCKAFNDPSDSSLMPHALKDDVMVWTGYDVRVRNTARAFPQSVYSNESENSTLAWSAPDAKLDAYSGIASAGVAPTVYKLRRANQPEGVGRKELKNALLLPPPGGSLSDSEFINNPEIFSNEVGRSGESEQSRLKEQIKKMEAQVNASGRGEILVGLATFTEYKDNGDIDPEGIPISFFVCPKETKKLSEEEFSGEMPELDGALSQMKHLLDSKHKKMILKPALIETEIKMLKRLPPASEN